MAISLPVRISRHQRNRRCRPEAEPDWIWINQADATATSVVLAVLRGARGIVRAKDVAEKVTAILPSASYGTVANVGSRLNEKQIRRAEDGWLLLTPETAGVVFRASFGVLLPSLTSLNWQRIGVTRFSTSCGSFEPALKHPILGELQKCNSWVRAPINKDLLKEDMEALQGEGKG